MKINIKLILIIVLFISKNVASQNIKVIYSSHYELPDSKYLAYMTAKSIKDLQKKRYHFLYKNDSTSIFLPVKTAKDFIDVDTLIVDEDHTTITKNIVSKVASDIFYFNYKNNCYIRKLNIRNEIYDVKDTIPKLNWTIQKDTTKMKGYVLQKATTTYHNLNITAWFTEDVPISAGPRIFTGLPGLIMKLKMNLLIYEIEKITFLKKSPTITPPKQDHTYLTSQQLFTINQKHRVKSSITKHECATCPK